MAIVVGTNAPKPRPCTARKRINSWMLWEAPDSAEPAMNTTTPRRNSRFLPYRSDSFPKIGIVTTCTMRKALKTQAYRLSPPSSEMIVGPAVDTMVTSMKASRSPASRPARMRVTVLRECNVSAGASRSVVAREMSSAISFEAANTRRYLPVSKGVATHNEKSDRPLSSGTCHPSHRTVPRRSSPAQIVDWAPSGLLQGFVNEVLSGPLLVGHDGHVRPRDSRPTPISITARISGPPGCLGREPPHRIEVTPQLTVDSTRSGGVGNSEISAQLADLAAE